VVPLHSDCSGMGDRSHWSATRNVAPAEVGTGIFNQSAEPCIPPLSSHTAISTRSFLIVFTTMTPLCLVWCHSSSLIHN